MPQVATKSYLASLPRLATFADVADEALYRPLPDGWFVAVADIVDSTGALAAGRYKIVNMAGAAVIAAVLNQAGRQDLPFVFGGDGAAVAVPPEAEAPARQALGDLATWARAEMGLEMRVALVPLAAIRATGRDVRIAWHRPSDHVRFAMFAGGGTRWAEEEMKAGRFAVPPSGPGAVPDLHGLSCRWSPVRARHGRIVSIIVLPEEGADPAAFNALVARLVALAAEAERGGHPLPEAGPKPRASFRGMLAEAKAQRTGRVKALLTAAVGMGLVRVLHPLGLSLGTFDARQYTRDVSANSDFRKFDDGLKMTLDVGADRLARIEAALEAAQGLCRYGLHVQDEALVTCLVPTALSRDHMHFIDGAAGGYAMAAARLKDRLSARE